MKCSTAAARTTTISPPLSSPSHPLSYLARAICLAAGEDRVVSPALINLTQGTPNQIIIRGDFAEKEARIAFYQAWRTLVITCRDWIETKLPHYRYTWRKDWDRWASHAWEFFWAQGASITEARRQLNELKRARAWVGINWIGESSTLSGADAIAWPHMSQAAQPKERHLGQEDQEIREFYRQLIGVLGEAFVDETEQLSIPELMKRLITYQPIALQLEIAPQDRPENFRDLNLSRREENRWTGWFQGDGDSIGVYLRSLRDRGEDEGAILRQFSQALMNWGHDHLIPSVESHKGRVIYAGGDDFLGVFYQAPAAQTCLDWFYRFKAEVWQQHQQGISVSVGFVWAAPGVPQRDVLQHCKEAEQSAKQRGRDRIACRILFNGGNSLEWVCPWWFLETVLTSYRDRNGEAASQASKWTHLYNDVAALEARHAFQEHQTDVAIALFDVYFGSECRTLLEQHLWDGNGKTGILGNRSEDCPNPATALNQWVISLAKVGFHVMAPR